MSYLVFARKYRPQRFDEVVGQRAVATTLKNAIQSGRVAHAYLFSGPRGVGKTSMARILSKALNCESGTVLEPCNECDMCVHISNGDDLDVLELDGATNRGIDEVRQIRDNVRYAPSRGRHKIYIIDEVHMLTKEAFNALLKTLEEPPAHVKFIFATTEVHRIPETILSRCQRFDFKRITNQDIVQRLRQICDAEGVEAPDEVLQGVARAARGAMRDSQSLLDKLISFGHTKLTRESLNEIQGASGFEDLAGFVDGLAQKRPGDALIAIDRMMEQGRDLGEFLNQLIDHLRMLMLLQVGGEELPLLEVTQDELVRLKTQTGHFSVDSLIYMIQLLSESRMQMRYSMNTRIPVELAVVKIAQMEDLRPMGEIIKRLAQLEQSLQRRPPAPANPGAESTRGAPAPPAGNPSPVAAAPASPPAPPVPPAPPAPGKTVPAPTEAASAPAGEEDAASPAPAEEPIARVAPPKAAPPKAAPPEAAPPEAAPPEAAPPEDPLRSVNWREVWPQIVASVEEEDATLGNCLRAGLLVEAADGRLRVGFLRKDVFSFQRLQQMEKRKVVEGHAARALGGPVRVAVTELGDEGANASLVSPVAEGSAGAPAESAPEPRAGPVADAGRGAPEEAPGTGDLTEHPLIKKIQDAFDAHIVSIYEDEPGHDASG